MIIDRYAALAFLSFLSVSQMMRTSAIKRVLILENLVVCVGPQP